MDVRHETLVFEREFSAPPARLFQAFRDPREREIWSAPDADTEIRIDETDLRTGGRETGRCGPRGDLKWTTKVIYHLVADDRLITFTEELWDGEHVLTVALITFEFASCGGEGTTLRLTDQVTSFVGGGGVSGHREGYTKALDNLSRSLVPA